jgi:hypothetical protein
VKGGAWKWGLTRWSKRESGIVQVCKGIGEIIGSRSITQYGGRLYYVATKSDDRPKLIRWIEGGYRSRCDTTSAPRKIVEK